MNDASRSSAAAPTRHAGVGLFGQEFWGIDRHELIAGAAQQLLTERAREKVERITSPLGSGVRLAELAGWADRIKRRAPAPGDDLDTVAFLNDPRNRQQDRWHYVNLPLDATGYSRERYPSFTRDDDVVQTIMAGIRVLAGESDRFSELNALRLVVHCVGDVFQPIHVGCSYLDLETNPPQLVFDPEVAASRNLRSDTGGNALLLPLGTKGVSLHSYWDGRLGGRVVLDEIAPDAMDAAVAAAEADEATAVVAESDIAIDEATRREFVDKLMALMPAPAGAAFAAAPLPDPLESWPVAWAADSLVAAREAYRSLSIDRPAGSTGRSFFVRWEGQEAYVARCKPIVVQRLTAAARGLADLLNGVWS
ncbi:S1/P1 nuclease [Variovorax guangxiensis]|uniref:S1/P1 nuclease n=1 Tax=Variovorax guangxiensis TaxID=1775474 RepID=UPI00286B9C82|nr:S1/P1 nuclease [Variovorax guangxiensis]